MASDHSPKQHRPPPPEAPPKGREGPRPLPLHLSIAAMTWLGSQSALPLLRSGWPGWNPAAGDGLKALAAEAAAQDPESLGKAVEEEVRRRWGLLTRGIEAYRGHPYRRDLPAPPVLWQEGTARLLDYAPASRDSPTVLAVPSLINRAYILDLTAERSLMRFLAGAGFRPLLLDWDAPGEVERGFTLTDYIAGRLGRAIDAACALGGPVALIGYCMGGLLALPAAVARPAQVSGLACLATPWDFHAERPHQARLIGAALPALEPLLRQSRELPVDVIQALFAGLDPLLVVRKFVKFAGADPASPGARMFVALEDWLNDGVPLAAEAARECLGGWYGANAPGQGAWRIAGEAVDPAGVAVPSLIVVPHADRIVPPGSALGLAARMPQATVMRPASGHIGMVAGGGAPEQLYKPLAAWLSALSRQAPRKSARGSRKTRFTAPRPPSYVRSQMQNNGKGDPP
jgi:polyhydroxyalkanoate synthase